MRQGDIWPPCYNTKDYLTIQYSHITYYIQKNVNVLYDLFDLALMNNLIISATLDLIVQHMCTFCTK